jgi:hypothetical protein
MQRCMIQSRKMVFDRLHRPQTRLTFVRQGSLSSTCSDASIFLLNHCRTFFFSAWAASRSAWVFSCVLRFLSNDSGTRTWSFVGTLLLVLASPVIVMGVCTFRLRSSTCPNLPRKGCVPEKSHQFFDVPKKNQSQIANSCLVMLPWLGFKHNNHRVRSAAQPRQPPLCLNDVGSTASTPASLHPLSPCAPNLRHPNIRPNLCAPAPEPPEPSRRLKPRLKPVDVMSVPIASCHDSPR